MCLPSFPNLISEIEAMISVKNDLEPGASSNLYMEKPHYLKQHQTAKESKGYF